MSDTTAVRIDRETHAQLERLAASRGATMTETVAHAVRVLRQEEMARELRAPLSAEEIEWLDADLD